jgi:hypothetical protein
MDDNVVFRLRNGEVEQSADERDLSRPPWLFVVDVTALDRSYLPGGPRHPDRTADPAGTTARHKG